MKQGDQKLETIVDYIIRLCHKTKAKKKPSSVYPPLILLIVSPISQAFYFLPYTVFLMPVSCQLAPAFSWNISSDIMPQCSVNAHSTYCKLSQHLRHPHQVKTSSHQWQQEASFTTLSIQSLCNLHWIPQPRLN